MTSSNSIYKFIYISAALLFTIPVQQEENSRLPQYLGIYSRRLPSWWRGIYSQYWTHQETLWGKVKVDVALKLQDNRHMCLAITTIIGDTMYDYMYKIIYV